MGDCETARIVPGRAGRAPGTTRGRCPRSGMSSRTRTRAWGTWRGSGGRRASSVFAAVGPVECCVKTDPVVPLLVGTSGS